MMKMSLKTWIVCLQFCFTVVSTLQAADKFVSFIREEGTLELVTSQQRSFSILCADEEHKGVLTAVHNLQEDFYNVADIRPALVTDTKREGNTDGQNVRILIGSFDESPFIKHLVKSKKLDARELKGKNEKFIITTVKDPIEGFPGEVLLIAGSDKRGTIYGVYELSRQIGVSPWYWWADVPIRKQQNVYVKPGQYTDGEPAVTYRGIFLNDEAPCLTRWVKHTYGTNYGDHRFYARVCELILRLKGNFLWPAMWSWAFYADDPQNSKTADEMGIIIGTSHHEPMAVSYTHLTLPTKLEV